MCTDWQILKSSAASFRISWFARLHDLDHTNNQYFDLRKEKGTKESLRQLKQTFRGPPI